MATTPIKEYSVRRMITFVGTHTYSFLHFESAKKYDENGHYNYTITFKDKDAEGNVVEGAKVGLTTIFNKDKLYVIVDSTEGLSIKDVQRLDAFGECLKRNCAGHLQEGKEYAIVFENDKVVEKGNTITVEPRKSTKANLAGECLAERKAAKSEEEKLADKIAKKKEQLAKLEASFASMKKAQ